LLHFATVGHYKREYGTVQFFQLTIDCPCDDPEIGCGWMAFGAGRVGCTSCSYLRTVTSVIKGAEISGCGGFVTSGKLIYNDSPNVLNAGALTA